MKPLFQTALLLAFICTLCGCKVDMKQGGMDDPGQPLYLELINSDVGTLAISVSPFDGLRDTLVIDRPLTNLIVMSTSHVGFLDALDALDCVSGISGKDFIFTSQKVLENEDIADVGYDAAPDYEKIVELKPDLLLT